MPEAPLPPSPFDQHGYRCKLQWGWSGAKQAAHHGDIVVVVDVLRFSSAVAMAAARDVQVIPCAFAADARAIAETVGGVAATRSQERGPSLSPRSFDGVEAGTRVVLPSLNGAQCSVNASTAPHVLAGSLLNASATARAVKRLLESTALDVTFIACGERWANPGEDGELRHAIEDLLGAGAILAGLEAFSMSPEARLAARAFRHSSPDIDETVLECASGRELRALGRERDVRDCARIDAVDAVPVLLDGWYTRLAIG